MYGLRYGIALRAVLCRTIFGSTVVSRLDSTLPVGRSGNPVFFVQTATIRPLPFPICVLCIAYVEHPGIHNEEKVQTKDGDDSNLEQGAFHFRIRGFRGLPDAAGLPVLALPVSPW